MPVGGKTRLGPCSTDILSVQPKEPLPLDDKLTTGSKQVLNKRIGEYIERNRELEIFWEFGWVTHRDSLIVTSAPPSVPSGPLQESLSPPM